MEYFKLQTLLYFCCVQRSGLRYFDYNCLLKCCPYLIFTENGQYIDIAADINLYCHHRDNIVPLSYGSHLSIKLVT